MADPLLCVVCSQVEPREGVVCDRDRQRLAQALWELRDLHALLPYALPPGRGEVMRVGGSRERQLPLRTEVLDLAGPATLTAVLDEAGDQVGAVAVASMLDSWAQDWASSLDEPLPAPSVDALVAWLSRRLPWALDHHPAIDEFAKELTTTLYACRAALNVSRRPIYSPLACPSCNVAALRRQAGDPSWRCGACRAEVEVEHPDDCECRKCQPITEKGSAMGTDIHAFVEVRDGDAWKPLPGGWAPFDYRDYGLYGFLADVRNHSHVPVIVAPRGLPDDCSQEVRDAYAEQEVDFHSSSWLTVAELRAFDYDRVFWNRRVTKRLPSGVLDGAALADEGEGELETVRKLLGSGYFADLGRLERLWPASSIRVVFWFDG